MAADSEISVQQAYRVIGKALQDPDFYRVYEAQVAMCLSDNDWVLWDDRNLAAEDVLNSLFNPYIKETPLKKSK